MFVELWLESWREDRRRSGRQAQQGEPNSNSSNKVELHEWLVPFPGLFHAEKQAMYALCKEMLDGVGLNELAGFAGLSQSQVSKILSHSHAMNNRAVLFNLCCAFVVHLTDMLLLENNDLAQTVSKMHSSALEKNVSCDPSSLPASTSSATRVHAGLNARQVPQTMDEIPTGVLYEQTTEVVTADVIRVGRAIRKGIEEQFTRGPNGRHFVSTVLLSCLLPTLGFHVLSRTGHTGYIDAFWFKHNSILHSSNHLKYQELSLFYAFFRCIIPSVVEEELYKNQPGRSVMKLLSFTGNGRNAVDTRGWTYVHNDEGLEMLSVRHVKSLSSNFITHLENSAAWLMEVSMFRAFARFVTGAARTIGRRREEADGGEQAGPLHQFDRNACQWRTVCRILHVMRERGFLSPTHRGEEWITNVFSSPPRRMNIKKDQDLLLEVSQRGKVTSRLHASVLFPDVFGPLSEDDKQQYFDGKKFKKWTRSRSVLRPAQSMSKQSGCVVLGDSDTGIQRSETFPEPKILARRAKDKDGFLKVVMHRKRVLEKAKDSLCLEQRKAMDMENTDYLMQVIQRWDYVHRSRHLISPFADCFMDINGKLNHAAKSRFLKYSARGDRWVIYPFNEISTDVEGRKTVSTNVYESQIGEYYCLQVDVMNALHYLGDTGGAGTSLRSVVNGKMKTILRPWINSRTASTLKQIHLHIDDPSLVISQKASEQIRRDGTRVTNGGAGVGKDMEDFITVNRIGFDDELCVPWNSLLVDREYKDELASLHLFCAAQAALQLVSESQASCVIYMHGGNFSVPISLMQCSVKDLSPCRVVTELGKNLKLKRTVLLKLYGENHQEQDYWTVPRSQCLVFDTNGNARIGEQSMKHGESETRFVCAFERYVRAPFLEFCGGNSGELAVGQQQRQTRRLQCSGCLILSDDTDVFAILLANEVMHGYGILHVVKDSYHDVDEAIRRLDGVGVSGRSAAMGYCIGGCDFTPGFYRVRHEHLLHTLALHGREIGSIEPPIEHKLNTLHLFVCLLLLCSRGKYEMVNATKSREKMRGTFEKVSRGELPPAAVNAMAKSLFVSEYPLGSEDWIVDVKNFLTDNAVYSNELLCDLSHLKLHLSRAAFIIEKYWGISAASDISAEKVGGCSLEWGYGVDGTPLLEKQENVKAALNMVKSVIKTCSCKGRCNTKICSCSRDGLKCIGCACADILCENRFRTGDAEPRGLIENETTANVGVVEEEEEFVDSETTNSVQTEQVQYVQSIDSTSEVEVEDVDALL